MADKKKNIPIGSSESVDNATVKQTASKTRPITDEFTRLSDLEAADGYKSEPRKKIDVDAAKSMSGTAEEVSPIQKDLAASYHEPTPTDAQSQHDELADDIKKKVAKVSAKQKDSITVVSTSDEQAITITEDRALQLVEEIVPESIRNKHPEVVKKLVEKAQTAAFVETDDDISSLLVSDVQDKKMRDAVYAEIQHEYADIIPANSLHTNTSTEKLTAGIDAGAVDTESDTLTIVNGIPKVGVSSEVSSTKAAASKQTVNNVQSEEITATTESYSSTSSDVDSHVNNGLSGLGQITDTSTMSSDISGASDSTVATAAVDRIKTSKVGKQTSDVANVQIKKKLKKELPDGMSSTVDRTDFVAGGVAVAEAKAQGKSTGGMVVDGLNASGLGEMQMSEVADTIEDSTPGIVGAMCKDELDMLRDTNLTAGETAGAVAAGAAIYAGEVTPDNVATVGKATVKAAPALLKYQRKKRRKRRRRIILAVVILLLLIIILFAMMVIPPIISAVLSITNEQEAEKNDPAKNYTYVDGQPIETDLTGGIGVDYAALIAQYQAEYDKAETDDERYAAAGKLAYTQLFQLLDTASLETRHPLLLLGVAMAIRETSTFSASPASWAKNKIDGDLREGIYGVYFNKYINGVPSSGAGGSYEHSDGHYNLGAKGPLQIECDRYVLYTTNTDGSITITKDEASGSIPDYDSSVVSYMPYVSADKSHLTPLKNNPTYTNVILTKVGHPNYISDYAAYIQTVDEFKRENGYLFPDRFQNSSTAYEDFVKSLESVPNAFLLMTSYMVSNWPAQKFDELPNVFDTVSEKTLLDRNISAYGYTLETTFKSEVAYEVYWTLCMLQKWNFGSNGYQYGSDSIVYQMDRLFVEISNFVATNGLAALYDQCSSVIGNNYCTAEEKAAYDNLINFVCTANGTDPTELIAAHDTYIDKNTAKKKTPYGYAISGLLDAYYYGNKQAVEVLGLTSFDIANYGGTNSSGTVLGGAGSYDSKVNYTGSHEVKSDLPCGTKGEQVVYYYTASGEKRWLDSSNWCSMFDPAQNYITTSHFAKIGSGNVHATGHGGVDTCATAGQWMTYTIADCKVLSITRCDISYHTNYKRIDSSGKVVATYNSNPGGYVSCGTSITYQLLDGSGLIVTQMHLRPGCLDDINVGDILPQGMAIGYASTTGHSTGNHSHTEFKIAIPDAAKPDGMKLNAEPFINSRVNLQKYGEPSREEEFRQNGL